MNPSADHAALSVFDNLLRSASAGIADCDISDLRRSRACLTINEGGPGEQVASPALPAFLASATNTLSPGHHFGLFYTPTGHFRG